jgi:hypothetical protein
LPTGLALVHEVLERGYQILPAILHVGQDAVEALAGSLVVLGVLVEVRADVVAQRVLHLRRFRPVGRFSLATWSAKVASRIEMGGMVGSTPSEMRWSPEALAICQEAGRDPGAPP